MSVPFCSIGCVSQRELYPSHPARNWLCFAKSSPTIGRDPKIGFARQKRAWAASQAARESRKAAPILESGGGADPRSARNALVPPPRKPGHATSRPGSPQSGSCFRSKPNTCPSPRKLVLFRKTSTNDLARSQNWLCSAKSQCASQPTQIGSVLQNQHQRSGAISKLALLGKEPMRVSAHANWFCSAKPAATIWRDLKIGFARQKATTRPSRRKLALFCKTSTNDLARSQNSLCSAKANARPSPRKLVLFCKCNTNDLAPLPKFALLGKKATTQLTSIDPNSGKLALFRKISPNDLARPKIGFARQNHQSPPQNWFCSAKTASAIPAPQSNQPARSSNDPTSDTPPAPNSPPEHSPSGTETDLPHTPDCASNRSGRSTPTCGLSSQQPGWKGPNAAQTRAARHREGSDATVHAAPVECYEESGPDTRTKSAYR